MSDWDLLFLQAAGKGGQRSLHSDPDKSPENLLLTKEIGEEAYDSNDLLDRSKRKRKSTSTAARGYASKCLRQCGFEFSNTVHNKCEKLIGARYQLLNSWDVSTKKLSSTQAAIREMFLLVRNSRAAGYVRSDDSVDPICYAYKVASKVVLSSLLELQVLVIEHPELLSTKQHIQKAIAALTSLSKETTIKNCKMSKVTSSAKGKSDGKFSRERKNCLAHVACMNLIASLDSIYGELLVAALDAGAILPDPRLYLESLCGETDYCFSSSSSCSISSSSSSSSSSSNSSSNSNSSSSSSCDTYQKNPLFRYLELRTIESDILNIPLLCKSAVEIEGLNLGCDEGTMRWRDPLSCPTVRSWWSAVRYRVAAWSAFACPNTHAIMALNEFSHGLGVLEVGAGVGYWACMLRNAGIDVQAYDKQPPSSNMGKKAPTHSMNPTKVLTNEYHGRFDAWSAVSHGDAASSSNSRRVLLLCYPPPKDPMALRALRCYTGDRIAHVGEMKGDTGTREFEAELGTQWMRHGDPIVLPNFGDTCYALTLWNRREKEKGSKNGASTTPSQYLGLMVCSSCYTAPHTQDGQTIISWYRDRLTRNVWACSLACVLSTGARCALKREMLLRFIDYGMSDTPIDDYHLWKVVVL